MGVSLRKRKAENGKQYLFVDVRVKGHARSRESLGMYLYVRPKDQLEKNHNTETTRQAKEKAAAMQLELQAGVNGVSNVATTKQTFDAFFQKYIDSYEKKDIKKFTYALYHFRAFKKTSPFQLSQHFVDGFKKYLTEGAGLSGETPFTYIQKFQKICKLAYKAKVIKTDPEDINFSLKFDRFALRKEILDEPELVKLYEKECPSPVVGKYWTLILNTGLRPGDAAKLTLKDVMTNKIAIEQGKTGRFVYLNLNNNVRQIIKSLRAKEPEDLLFPGLPSQGIINEHLETWCRDAGITKNITIYCARHTYCTLLMRRKVDYKTIISLMGWDEKEGMKHLMRYAHFADEDAKAAIERLPAMDLTKLTKYA